MKKIAFFILVGFVWASSSSASDEDVLHLASTLEKSNAAYEALHDYKAIFHKEERSDGVMGPQETIFLKFEKPFKIFMGWQNTHKKGLQVLYERGARGNKLAIHKPGLLFGLAQVIYLDQNSPWVREGSASYDIEDAGIGSFLEDFTRVVAKGAENDQRTVAWLDADTVDVVFTGSKEREGYFAYRVNVHFDAKTSLPDRMLLFDWKNEPMGVYSYEDLELDIGENDGEFKKTALGKLYRLYFPQEKSAGLRNFSGKNRPATPKEA